MRKSKYQNKELRKRLKLTNQLCSELWDLRRDLYVKIKFIERIVVKIQKNDIIGLEKIDNDNNNDITLDLDKVCRMERSDVLRARNDYDGLFDIKRKHDVKRSNTVCRKQKVKTKD